MSLTESPYIQWCWDDDFLERTETETTDRYNGLNNQLNIRQIEGWRELFRAFAWCADQGEGMYLPAIKELETLLLNLDVYSAVNRTLEKLGAAKLDERGGLKIYWSSTNYDDDSMLSAFGIGMYVVKTTDVSKYAGVHIHARAVYSF